MTNLVQARNGDNEQLINGWWSVSRTNPKTGKREVMVNTGTDGKQYRVLTNAHGIVRNSVLPEDAWKSLEAAVIQEQSVPTNVIADLRTAGLVIPDSIWAVQHEFDVISEVTSATISIDGEGDDSHDQFQTERHAITVPIVSKSFSLGARALGAYNNVPGRSFNTDLARAATQVVMEAQTNAFFNGYAVQLSATSIAYGVVNHPDANTGASAGDWGTVGNAEATVSVMIQAESADNYFGPFTLYVSRVQYDEIALLYKSVDNNTTELDRILSLPQIKEVKQVSENFLAAGTAVLVQLQSNVVAWVEELPISIVEWQSPDGMTTQWRIMAVGAPRATSTWADRSGICVSTGN